MKNNLKTSLTQALEIPREVLADVSVMNIVGKSEIDIENYKSILEYSDSCISINTAVGIVVIEGSGLELKAVTSEAISVKGGIESLCFKEL